MKIIEIDKNLLFHFLTNRNCIGQGTNGIISEYDENSLIKIYYKKLFETYRTKDINNLDSEIDLTISVESILKRDTKKELKKEMEELINKKILALEDLGYLKGIIYYRGIKVGVIINYYKDYKPLGSIYPNLSEEEKKYMLQKVKEKILDLIKRNIYPMDIKEDHILVNPKTLEMEFIDLDDEYTRYEEEEYIIKHKLYHLRKTCEERYDGIVRRLK